MLKNMLIQSLTNMDVTLSYDNDSKEKKKKMPELHSSPSKLPDNQEKAKKKTHFTHFPIVTM